MDITRMSIVDYKLLTIWCCSDINFCFVDLGIKINNNQKRGNIDLLTSHFVIYRPERIMLRNLNTNFAASCKRREMRFHAAALIAVVKLDHLRDWVLLISRH